MSVCRVMAQMKSHCGWMKDGPSPLVHNQEDSVVRIGQVIARNVSYIITLNGGPCHAFFDTVR